MKTPRQVRRENSTSGADSQLPKTPAIPDIPRPKCLDLPMRGFCSRGEWEDSDLIYFVIESLQAIGLSGDLWRWPAILGKLPNGSPEEKERADYSLMLGLELALASQNILDLYGSQAGLDVDRPICLELPGLASHRKLTAKDFMFHACVFLYDLREVICAEIDREPQDWEAADVQPGTEGQNLLMAEVLVVAEHWINRDGMETDLDSQPCGAWNSTPTKVQALARRLRLALYRQAFENLRRGPAPAMVA